MKIAKKAEQKNFTLNKDFYAEWQLDCFLRNNIVFKIDDKDTEFRVGASQLSEVKVILKDGFYTTVAVEKNYGVIYYINL